VEAVAPGARGEVLLARGVPSGFPEPRLQRGELVRHQAAHLQALDHRQEQLWADVPHHDELDGERAEGSTSLHGSIKGGSGSESASSRRTTSSSTPASRISTWVLPETVKKNARLRFVVTLKSEGGAKASKTIALRAT
jgi:hypothetical protein